MRKILKKDFSRKTGEKNPEKEFFQKTWREKSWKKIFPEKLERKILKKDFSRKPGEKNPEKSFFFQKNWRKKSWIWFTGFFSLLADFLMSIYLKIIREQKNQIPDKKMAQQREKDENGDKYWLRAIYSRKYSEEKSSSISPAQQQIFEMWLREEFRDINFVHGNVKKCMAPIGIFWVIKMCYQQSWMLEVIDFNCFASKWNNR